MNLRKDHYRIKIAIGFNPTTTMKPLNHTGIERPQHASRPERAATAAVDRRRRPKADLRLGSPTEMNRSAGTYRCRRRGYLSRSFPPGMDGVSTGVRRSSSGIRCPAASNVVASARFKEPHKRSSRPPTSGGRPSVVFPETFRTLNVLNLNCVRPFCCCMAAAARLHVSGKEDER